MSISQPLEALEHGNKIRYEIALERLRISKLPSWEGARRAAEVVESGEMGAMRLGWLLRSIKGVGPSKVEMWCESVSHHCTREHRLDQMHEFQRERLASALRRYADRQERRNGGTREKAGA